MSTSATSSTRGCTTPSSPRLRCCGSSSRPAITAARPVAASTATDRMEAASPISAPGAEVRPAGETDIEQVREIGRDYGGLAAWPEAPDYLDHARVSSRLLVAAEGECSASGRSWRGRPHHLRLERSAGPDS